MPQKILSNHVRSAASFSLIHKNYIKRSIFMKAYLKNKKYRKFIQNSPPTFFGVETLSGCDVMSRILSRVSEIQKIKYLKIFEIRVYIFLIDFEILVLQREITVYK